MVSRAEKWVIEQGLEPTRDNLIAALWGSTPPDDWSVEDEEELPPDLQDWDSFELEGMEFTFTDFNPFHEPAGSPIGGRFAKHEGSGHGTKPTARTSAGEVPNRGSVSGSTGGVETSGGPDLTAPLTGLPTPVEIPGVGKIAVGPDPRARQAAYDYMREAGLPYTPPTDYVKVDPARATRVAAEYDKMADVPNDPEVKAAYAAMIRETVAQYRVIEKTGLDVDFIDFEKTGDPYAASPRLATEDVRKNNHLWVFPTNAGFGSDAEFDPSKNPLLADTGIVIKGHHMVANDVFRIVHDYFGHIKEGNGFRADGEENAWRSHSAMYSPLARRAMTSETRGQNSWVNYGPYGESNRKASSGKTHFADQKTGLMPEWTMSEGSGNEAPPHDPTRNLSWELGNSTQPVKSLDELYERAKAAEPAFKESIQTIGASTGGKVFFAPPSGSEPGTTLKPRASAERKLNSELGGDATKLRDILRATVVHPTVGETRNAVVTFMMQQGNKILRVKDRFVSPVGGGYRDILINFRTDDGLVAEVQFNSRNLLEAKQGGGHRYYNESRVLEKEKPTPELTKRLRDLAKSSMQLYEDAYQRDGNGRGWSRKEFEGVHLQ